MRIELAGRNTARKGRQNKLKAAKLLSIGWIN